MSLEQQPLSRRALREAERAAELAAESPEPLQTRRQLRELERARELLQEQQVPHAPTEQEVVPTNSYSKPEAPVAPQQASASRTEAWSSTDTGSIFTVSPVVGAEPTTNSTSIVIEQPRDPLEELTATSGSIALPAVSDVVSSVTGELSLIREAQEADFANAREASASFQADIPPVPASGVIKGRARERVFPKSIHTGRAQMYLVLTTIILIVAIAGLLGAGFMLGYFN